MKVRLASSLSALLLFCGCNDIPEQERASPVGEARSAVVTSCLYLDKTQVPPLPVPVRFENELVINSTKVVDDPCRTRSFGGSTCAPGTVGVWTFGHLMTQMAGARPASELVGEWLHHWEVASTVNGFTIPDRAAGIRAALIDPWLVASGCNAGDPIVGLGACPLDLRFAPFRLLAIVNRVDLSGPVGAPPLVPGEGRFVFGFLGAGPVETAPPLQATVIFEYKLPSFRDAFAWAQEWHALSALPLGSPPYRSSLQQITDAFVNAGVEPGNPNLGSAIGQVRTNEIAFGSPWELREFTLQGANPNAMLLTPSTTAGTPDDSFNQSPALDAWLSANEPDILTLSHVVPPAFLGGGSTAPVLWDHSAPTPLAPMTRHLFGFSTCNGCHSGETQTSFVHVAPRTAGTPAALSPFLSQTTNNGAPGLPASWQTFSDPAGTGLALEYNEPWRRTCEVTRLLHGDPTPYTREDGSF